MKLNPGIAKFFAILLLLVFSQKIGAGIYLHNWLHPPECNQAERAYSDTTISKVCNCIDDFSLPFTEPVIESAPGIGFPQQTHVSFYIRSLPFSSTAFISLRGPPVPLV